VQITISDNVSNFIFGGLFFLSNFCIFFFKFAKIGKREL